MKKIFIIVAFLSLVGTVGVLFFFMNKEQIVFADSPPIIGIQPLGNISVAELDSIESSIKKMYEFETVMLNRRELPDRAYTTIRVPRYRADSLVFWLPTVKPDSVDIIVGLTNQDISITKYKEGTLEIKEPEWQYKDFGIFGLGSVGGSSCVISSNRLHKGVSDKQFYIRLTRITCHEVGHVLGLRHCPEANCLMNDANESIKTIDNSTGVLCLKCKHKI